MVEIDPYATHLPALAACAARCAGPVLELGVGWYSTPLLHAHCGSRGLDLFSVESAAAWLNQFLHMAAPWHEFLQARMPDEAADLASRLWGLVVVDNAKQARVPWIERVADTAGLIVVHDTELPGAYGYEPCLSEFAHRVDYKRLKPWTSVVSNTQPLDWLRRLWKDT